jgi:hydroxymethylglutaryl-CoA lyase
MSEVVLHEVGMRDGLQVEQAIVPAEQRVRWIERLIAAGVDIVQAGSFVNPKVVPQMADTDEVFRQLMLPERPALHARLSALVLNEKGLARGLAVGARFFCMGVSASDTHSRKNTGMSTAEAADRVLAMARTARGTGAAVQLSVQSAFGCGYEGAVPEARVLDLVARFIDAGFLTISLADTAGHGTPLQVRRLFTAIHRLAPDAACACHFHDTYGAAMANACAAIDAGVRTVEAAVGGLGGCPFTALAAGNLCTEDVVHLLQRSGLRSGIDLDALIAVANEAEQFFGRPLPGIVHRTGAIATSPALNPEP